MLQLSEIDIIKLLNQVPFSDALQFVSGSSFHGKDISMKAIVSLS